MRSLRLPAARIGLVLKVGLAVTGTCALALVAGAWSAASVASVGATSTSSRLRSGTLHAQFASHMATGRTAVPSGLALTGANITATVVGTLALLSLAFVVVTLIRRRSTP